MCFGEWVQGVLGNGHRVYQGISIICAGAGIRCGGEWA